MARKQNKIMESGTKMVTQGFGVYGGMKLTNLVEQGLLKVQPELAMGAPVAPIVIGLIGTTQTKKDSLVYRLSEGAGTIGVAELLARLERMMWKGNGNNNTLPETTVQGDFYRKDISGTDSIRMDGADWGGGWSESW